MFKKIVTTICILGLLTSNAIAGKVYTIDQLKGLERNPQADAITDGAHSKFDNLYIKDKHVRSVKGRVKLNATANSNTTINGFWYYENAAGSTKKLVVMENTVLASYDTDGTNRTSLNTGLTNEQHTAKQVGDTLYITSITDGLYKWTGSGAATAISGVAAPSNVDFSATTGNGGMTPGLPAVVVHTISNTAGGVYFLAGSTCTQFTSSVADYSEDNTACGSLSGSFLKTCATDATYSYKVTKYSSKSGIESEPSTADTAALTGSNTVNVAGRDCFPLFGSNTCTSTNGTACQDTIMTITGQQTRTTGTIASAPSAPFDSYRIYRTVAGGVDYFLLGVAAGGITYTDGKPDVALIDHPLDTTIDTIDPPKAKFIEEYKGVLFLATGSDIYFSHEPVQFETSADTYWLKTDDIPTGTKEPITGLKSTSNSLLIFTSQRVLELTGFGVSSFRLKVLFEGIGAVNQKSITADNDGNIFFFSGTRGVYKLKVGQPSTDDKLGSVIDTNRASLEHLGGLEDTFRGTDSQIVLTVSDFTTANAYYDMDNDLYFLYVGSDGFVYDNMNKAWSHIPGVKSTSSLYRKSPGVAGQGVITDDLGFMYDNFKSYTNGVTAGTVTGSPTSSTGTTLVDSGASFTTTGSGLLGAWVILDNGTTLQYRQITTNSGTSLTVGTWTVNPVVTDTYYIGYIIPDATTKQYSLSKPPGQTVVQAITWVHNKSDASQLFYDTLTYKTQDTLGTTSSDSFDLTTNFIDKRGLSATGNWVQVNYRMFIYNTSNTINPPLDLINYTLTAYPVEDE